tara:strand:+ start:873 stop:1052 length:180 start_codon:yes stop_codon:yes gene_type:complete
MIHLFFLRAPPRDSFFGNPAFILAYALGEIVDLDFERLVPDFFFAFMFLYKLISTSTFF